MMVCFFFSSRRRHTRYWRDWSSDVCSSDLLGKVLRMGAYDEEVLTRLRWMRDVLGPVLQAAVRSMADPLDVKAVLAQMLQMGDEGHNRNRAGSLMTLRELAPAVVEVDAPSSDIAAVLRFVGGNEHFFLNLGMPTAKLAMDAAAHVPGSTMVTVMSRNGTEFGIRTAGTGDRWFTGPANTPVGLFLGGYGPGDAKDRKSTRLNSSHANISYAVF